MNLAICRHVKLAGGGRCGSPALRGQNYCYFHAPAHRLIPSVNLWPCPKAGTLRQAGGKLSQPARQHRPWARCKLKGDALAIQVGLSGLVQGITQGSLNVRQAKLLLNALQRAAADLRAGSATGASAVTSNELQLPISGSCGAFASKSQRG